MSTSQTTLENTITQRLTLYFSLFQKLAYVLRPLPNRVAILSEGEAKWLANPAVRMPPAGDQVKIAQFFAECDEICGSSLRDPHKYVLRS